MPADDDLIDDRDDSARPRRGAPTFPVLATVAGVMWMLIGALGVVNGVYTLATGPEDQPALQAPAPANPAQAQAQAQGQKAGRTCGAVLGLLIAVAFLMAGYNTIKGKAKDTRGNAIGSIVLGLLAAAVGVMLATVFGGLAPDPDSKVVVRLTGLFVVAVGLGGYVLAGVLALVARRDYLAWRDAQDDYDDRPRRRRRPEPEDDYDDEDDRPRRRRE